MFLIFPKQTPKVLSPPLEKGDKGGFIFIKKIHPNPPFIKEGEDLR